MTITTTTLTTPTTPATTTSTTATATIPPPAAKLLRLRLRPLRFLLLLASGRCHPMAARPWVPWLPPGGGRRLVRARDRAGQGSKWEGSRDEVGRVPERVMRGEVQRPGGRGGEGSHQEGSRDVGRETWSSSSNYYYYVLTTSTTTTTTATNTTSTITTTAATATAAAPTTTAIYVLAVVSARWKWSHGEKHDVIIAQRGWRHGTRQ